MFPPEPPAAARSGRKGAHATAEFAKNRVVPTDHPPLTGMRRDGVLVMGGKFLLPDTCNKEVGNCPTLFGRDEEIEPVPAPNMSFVSASELKEVRVAERDASLDVEHHRDQLNVFE